MNGYYFLTLKGSKEVATEMQTTHFAHRKLERNGMSSPQLTYKQMFNTVETVFRRDITCRLGPTLCFCAHLFISVCVHRSAGARVRQRCRYTHEAPRDERPASCSVNLCSSSRKKEGGGAVSPPSVWVPRCLCTAPAHEAARAAHRPAGPSPSKTFHLRSAAENVP